MRIELACFTARGQALGARLEELLREAGETARLRRCGEALPLREWTAECFALADALIFVGAVGIAVRAVAPYLVSKADDPAVVAVDECGRFVVPLASGHIGGANALAARLAEWIGATPVITTATDANGVFAVDEWAARNRLAIANPERIKSVSAKLLAGKSASLWSAFPVAGELPAGLVRCGEKNTADIVIAICGTGEERALRLTPPVVVLGVGCRKGAAAEALEDAFLALCETADISPLAFGRVCSVDRKANEPGLVAFCRQRSLPFVTFSPEVLAGTAGDFASSAFVRDVTGVDNVCERSAVAGSGGGALVVRKMIVNGVAVAAAVREYAVDFTTGEGRDA